MPFIEYYKFVLVTIVPVAVIFKYAGFKPYWALLMAIPDIGLIVCAVTLALRKWPGEA